MAREIWLSVFVISILLSTQLAGVANAADDPPFIDPWVNPILNPRQDPRFLFLGRPSHDPYARLETRLPGFRDRPLDFTVLHYETPLTIGRRDVRFRVRVPGKQRALVSFQLRF